MSEAGSDLSGDYGYDLAHDVPRTAAAPRRPERAAPVSPPPADPDRRGDASYDEAHDF